MEQQQKQGQENSNNIEQQPQVQEQEQQKVQSQLADVEIAEDDPEALAQLDKMQNILQSATQLIGGYKQEISTIKGEINILQNQINGDKSATQIPQTFEAITGVYQESFDLLKQQNELLQKELESELNEKSELELTAVDMFARLENLQKKIDEKKQKENKDQNNNVDKQEQQQQQQNDITQEQQDSQN